MNLDCWVELAVTNVGKGDSWTLSARTPGPGGPIFVCHMKFSWWAVTLVASYWAKPLNLDWEVATSLLSKWLENNFYFDILLQTLQHINKYILWYSEVNVLMSYLSAQLSKSWQSIPSIAIKSVIGENIVYRLMRFSYVYLSLHNDNW